MAEVIKPQPKNNQQAWSILSTVLDKFLPGAGQIVGQEGQKEGQQGSTQVPVPDTGAPPAPMPAPQGYSTPGYTAPDPNAQNAEPNTPAAPAPMDVAQNPAMSRAYAFQQQQRASRLGV